MKKGRKYSKYLTYWLKTAELSFQTLTVTRGASAMYILGKFVRFTFFLWFLLILEDRIQKVAGYTLNQLITFFLVFNLFDMAGQIGADVHSVTGILAIFLMLVHAVWATVVLLLKNEKAINNFHHFSLIVWTIWLVPYLTGFFASMRI